MISAGPEIPNISTCDFRATRATSLRRRWAGVSSAFVVLPCLLVQGCGNSETKAVARGDPATPRTAYAKADILVPLSVRAAETVRPTAGDTFADRFFAD